MKILKSACLLVILILLCLPVGAQSNLPECDNGELPTEKVILHTDRDKYLVGEKIWFTAYCLLENSLDEDLSQVILIELYDYTGHSFVQQKVQIRKGIASGTIEIPEEVGTGRFFLRAYTQYLRNFSPADYANKVVTIINPLSDATKIQQAKKDGVEKNNEGISATYKELEWVALDLQTDQQDYQQRNKISLQLNNEANLNAHLSVSVRALGTGAELGHLPDYLQDNPWLAASYADQWPVENKQQQALKKILTQPELSEKNTTKTLNYAPDIRGVSLSGIVRDKSTKMPIPDVICMASVVGQQPQIHLNTSRADGSFVFAFDRLQGQHELCVGMRNREAENIEILINNDFSTDFPNIAAIPLPFDSLQHQLFEKMYLNEQIRKRYTWTQLVSSAQAESITTPSTNLGEPDVAFELADFVELPTLYDVFTEVIPFVKVKNAAKNRSLSVWDETKQLYNDNPVVLLDNVPIYDIDELLNLNPQNINRIEVIYSNYLLGDYIFGGLISLETNTDDFAGYNWPGESVFFPYATFTTSEAFQFPNYEVVGTDQSRKPDFRTTLYWNPDVKLDDPTLSLDMYASDFTGAYEVIVRGITKDGKLMYGRTVFNVKQK
ncbi:MAG: hypothetical protein DHS20C18_17910 [Saprospiraceae bacterium]|nr:MAG: hypothetical protein DHS20C18_17910 [Saprospiraceae bacterium]